MEQFLVKGDEVEPNDILSKLLRDNKQEPTLKKISNFGQGLNGLIHEIDEENELVADKFRVQISLGSTIESISNISQDGLTVKYSNGDNCNSETGERYSS